MPQQLDSPLLPKSLKLLFGLIVVLGIVSIPVGGWLIYDYSQIALEDGGYQLRVDIATRRSIREVRCYAAFERRYAEFVANDETDSSWNEIGHGSRTTPYLGSPIEARINTWGRSTRSGRYLSKGQDKWLAVVAEFDDGTRQGAVVEVPEVTAGREVRVEIP